METLGPSRSRAVSPSPDPQFNCSHILPFTTQGYTPRFHPGLGVRTSSGGHPSADRRPVPRQSLLTAGEAEVQRSEGLDFSQARPVGTEVSGRCRRLHTAPLSKEMPGQEQAGEVPGMLPRSRSSKQGALRTYQAWLQALRRRV